MAMAMAMAQFRWRATQVDHVDLKIDDTMRRSNESESHQRSRSTWSFGEELSPCLGNANGGSLGRGTTIRAMWLHVGRALGGEPRRQEEVQVEVVTSGRGRDLCHEWEAA
jgi:hypothetical protein